SADKNVACTSTRDRIASVESPHPAELKCPETDFGVAKPAGTDDAISTDFGTSGSPFRVELSCSAIDINVAQRTVTDGTACTDTEVSTSRTNAIETDRELNKPILRWFATGSVRNNDKSMDKHLRTAPGDSPRSTKAVGSAASYVPANHGVLTPAVADDTNSSGSGIIESTAGNLHRAELICTMTDFGVANPAGTERTGKSVLSVGCLFQAELGLTAPGDSPRSTKGDGSAASYVPADHGVLTPAVADDTTSSNPGISEPTAGSLHRAELSCTMTDSSVLNPAGTERTGKSVLSVGSLFQAELGLTAPGDGSAASYAPADHGVLTPAVADDTTSSDSGISESTARSLHRAELSCSAIDNNVAQRTVTDGTACTDTEVSTSRTNAIETDRELNKPILRWFATGSVRNNDKSMDKHLRTALGDSPRSTKAVGSAASYVPADSGGLTDDASSSDSGIGAANGTPHRNVLTADFGVAKPTGTVSKKRPFIEDPSKTIQPAEKVRKVNIHKKRKYAESYLGFGFTWIGDEDNQQP
ncbi:hypothetical protein pipiens_015699, partial [Culex pipiens pipiens]